MRRKLLFVITTFVLSLICSSQALAWEGQAIGDILGKSGDEGQYYIYNVGKKKFLTQSGIWGTSTGVDDSGLLMNAIKSTSSSGVYKFQSTLNGYLILASSDQVNKADAGHMFFDQSSDYYGTSWTVTKVSDTENIYTINCANPGNLYKNKYYITASKDDDSVEPTASVKDDYSKWMFVSVKTLKDEFDNAQGADVNNPIPASFFMYDAGFYRKNNNATEWSVGSSSSTLEISEVSKSYGSDGKVITIPSHSDNLLPTDAYNSSNALKSTYVYHIGNGYVHVKLGSTKVDDYGGTDLGGDKELLSNTADYDKVYWHRPYGRYWTANIHGKSGKIYQTINNLRKGWYKVTCYGMSTDGKGYLFASGDNTTAKGDKYSISNFTKPDKTPDTYVKASYMLITNPTKYEQSVTVLVENGTLTFGAEVTDGGEQAWTCFDSFSLAYCGEGELNLLIDETQGDIAYLNDQANDNYNQILRLNRELNTNKWNSFVLPVNLNAGQVKNAFGGDTKLAKLDRAEGNRIYFTYVSLDDNEATAISAGKLYIINPQLAMTEGDLVKHRNIETYNIQYRKYYTINQVTFKKANILDSPLVDDEDFQPGASSDGQMRMAGTYVCLTKTDGANPIPAGSYVISGGKWKYAVNGVSSVKGLRGWIETDKTSSSKSLIFNIDGVDEEEVSTGIDGLFVDGAETNTSISKTGVYSLSGQKISDNTNLPKGIYIVNGRKMIVK